MGSYNVYYVRLGVQPFRKCKRPNDFRGLFDTFAKGWKGNDTDRENPARLHGNSRVICSPEAEFSEEFHALDFVAIP